MLTLLDPYYQSRISIDSSGHEFTPANTYRSSSDNRACRACNRAAVRRYKARKGLTAEEIR